MLGLHVSRAETSVLIVGGGPVGLSTAIGLRRFGVECVLVERHPSTLDFPKGRRVTIRTMEIFRQWGLEDAVTAVALPREESLFAYRGETLLGDDFKRAGLGGAITTHSPTNEVVCSQELLEPVLCRYARAAGADVRFATRLIDFSKGADGVTAQLADLDAGERTTVRAEYLVAADGARGDTRSTLGIRCSTAGELGEWVSIRLEADLADRVSDRRSGVYWLSKPRTGAAFAAVDNERQWLLLVPRDREAEPQESFTEERCEALAREAIGDPRITLWITGVRFWTATARVADHFAAGRVFLAGDAAHLTTPIGGLGMNCGIADAHNLAWKLAGVLSGWAGPALLDSYEPERAPVARHCAQASLGAARPPKLVDGLVLGAAYQSDAVTPDGSDAPEPADALADYEPTARPGHRAPHLWLERDGKRCSTLDLWGEWFTLVVGQAGKEVAEASVRGIEAPLRCHVIGERTDSPIPSTTSLTYGIGTDGAVLVRPDGHVAWRTPELKPPQLQEALVAATARA